jgi:hypothetical protein
MEICLAQKNIILFYFVAVSIFLAFNINIISERQRTFGIVIASVWIACQVLWELFYEIRKRRRGKKLYNISKSYSILMVCSFLEFGLSRQLAEKKYQYTNNVTLTCHKPMKVVIHYCLTI